MSDKPSFFVELKQRKLVQWMLAYVAAAFALLQGVDIVAQRFAWPEQTMRIVILALTLGLFVTLVLAWYHGERGAQRISGTELLSIGLVLAMGGALLWRYTGWRGPAPTAASAPLAAALAGGPIDPKSVAVLAFANLSNEKNNESFADSVSEELLNVLGKVRGLKVTARTSAFHFKGKDVPIPEIGRQLGVAYVVEGSVRRSGEMVRIAAQLIKAADGFQVWSDDFNRDLKDIFAVQEEIAGLIAKNLELKLGVQNQLPPDPQAYQLYLEAVRLWGLRNIPSLERAEQLLQRAIALQPDYARAQAAMGFVLSVRSAELGNDPLMGEGRDLNEQALHWAERALTLDPNLAEAYAAKGNALENLGHWTECKEAYRRSIELDPNFATAHQWYSRNLSEEGNIEEAMFEMKRAVELDPLAPRILDNYGANLIWLGKYADALAVLEQALAIQPGSAQALSFKAMGLVRSGRVKEGTTILEELVRRPDQPGWTPIALAEALLASGRESEAQALLQHPPSSDFYHGLLLCALQRNQEAIPLLRPVSSIYRDILIWVFPELMPRNSPEFHRKLADWNMTDAWQRAETWREKNRPPKT
jgi:TolB-like protein/Tfp pilus assembly protein PilF